jgi:hypothetical protein
LPQDYDREPPPIFQYLFLLVGILSEVNLETKDGKILLDMEEKDGKMIW